MKARKIQIKLASVKNSVQLAAHLSFRDFLLLLAFKRSVRNNIFVILLWACSMTISGSFGLTDTISSSVQWK